ncbi:MAG TPA: HAMP domain-containing sensor histidine kinase [Flavobacterium sp.]|uniref:sensor histidine kinase n=1 Tax=Flavobacterium sp. TaxID=239 RepID=UPI002CC241E7|nr:HAMP domain-containing sensor histidine kinase [Flavobacterium sp.]HNP33074.1 HAMP domain-containing sensor histidine kinase [Flavobacterium sp.]
MRIKHQLAIFNALTRLLIIVVLWFSLPILIEKVVYKHIDKTLLEKKQKFIEHLDKEEINDFINRNDSTETYSSFSTLHNEFLQLYQSKEKNIKSNTIFKNESRIIEDEQNDYRTLYYSFDYENKSYRLEIGSSLSEIQDLTFVIRLFILIVLIIVVVFTFLVDTVFVEYLLKPFYKIINKKIRNVNAPERFDYTTIQSHSTDFRELDEVLNQMMKSIQELFSHEKQFIANVSHELLSPIALLKNRFENLLQNESINDEGIDKIASSMRTLDLLKKVINNLLLISRIENNQFANNEQISIKEIIAEILEDFEDRIEEKKLSVSNEVEDDFIFLGNRILIRIMLYNLILNAIKYNVAKGKIALKTNHSGDNYLLTITDTGKGMTATQMATIFERFTRIDIEQEGQGLGLAIVDSIAKFHHIEIKVDSKVDTGTTFTVQFPVVIKKS